MEQREAWVPPVPADGPSRGAPALSEDWIHATARPISRRHLLERTASAAGTYALVGRLADPRARASRRVATRPDEQHVVPGLEVVEFEGVAVVVPPLHHRVVTARIAVEPGPRALDRPRRELERILSGLEAEHEASPGGLTVTVGWGLPYFHRFVAGRMAVSMPLDRRASRVAGRTVPVIANAIRFPSDPRSTVLEANDVAILLRSDELSVVDEAHARIVAGMRGVLRQTSVRKGFVGGGFAGDRGLPKRMAVAAGVAGADSIPDGAELFLGFTSSQRHALGAPRIANIETLGYADMRDGYFTGGTHMHLSHLRINVAAWYLNFDRRERVAAMFRSGLRVSKARLTVPQPSSAAQTVEQVVKDYRRYGVIGHAGSIQTASRLDRDIVGVDGVRYPKGSPVPHRADFNTLDNPFAWSAHPIRDEMTGEPGTGLHFVAFNPTWDDFRRVRLAMDGALPDGTKLDLAPRARGQGLNSVVTTTHRQNFLVPPRRHRSFPLSERP